VPETYYGKQLWFKSDNVIDDYIKDLDNSWNPAKTLRMSIISGNTQGLVQMVIPFDLLNSRGGAMDIKVSCKEKMEDLPSARVTYDDWKDNIKGSRTDPESSLIAIPGGP